MRLLLELFKKNVGPDNAPPMMPTFSNNTPTANAVLHAHTPIIAPKTKRPVAKEGKRTVAIDGPVNVVAT